MAKAEKAVSFHNALNSKLAASLWPSDSETLIILAHGVGKNRYLQGVFQKLAPALQKQNFNVLAFDYSGHGLSDNVIFNTSIALEDTKAAVKYAEKKGYKKIALVGHSLGGYCTLRIWNKKIKALVTLGGVTGPISWRWKHRFSSLHLRRVYRKGYITAPVFDGLRMFIRGELSVLEDLEKIDQKKLFNKIETPILMIHGDADHAERELFKLSKKALKFLPAESKLAIIQGAHHEFTKETEQVINLTTKWFQKYLRTQ